MTYLCILVDEDSLTISENGIVWVDLPTLPEQAIALNHSTENQPNLNKTPCFALAYTIYQQLDTATPQTLQPFRRFISTLSINDLTLASRAIQLIRWQQNHRFCSRCGNTTQLHPKHDLAMVCTNCGYHQYPRVQPCVIVAITRQINNKQHILLAHHVRYNMPMYGLIAGFVEAGESLEDCIYREVMEETGLSVNNIRYFASQPWPYPSNLMIGFTADYADGTLNLQLDEIDDAQFFALDNLPKIPPKGSIAHRMITHLCRCTTS